MSKNNISDFIILGGGCSALSFIDQVIEKNITKYSFIVLEKQKKYSDDKSWCFWSEELSFKSAPHMSPGTLRDAIR